MNSSGKRNEPVFQPTAFALVAAEPQKDGGASAFMRGRSALALRKKAALYQCALALGSNSGARAATVTTRSFRQFSILRKACISLARRPKLSESIPRPPLSKCALESAYSPSCAKSPEYSCSRSTSSNPSASIAPAIAAKYPAASSDYSKDF